jgi:hypothetical protein
MGDLGEDDGMPDGGWQPVEGGWMKAPDPGEPDVDYFEADRLPKVRRRAAAIGQAADLFADRAFDPAETWDSGKAAGLTDANLDAAAYVALEMEKIERGFA